MVECAGFENRSARKGSGSSNLPLSVSQQNLFTRILRLVSHTRSRAMAVEECGRVLQCLSLLTPSETTISLDPNPISVGDWRELLDAAAGLEDRAMLLLMLNCGMYLAEVVALRCQDIKGEYLNSSALKRKYPDLRKVRGFRPNNGDALSFFGGSI